MNTFTTALITLGLGLCASVATAGSIEAPVSKTVNFAALDVTKDDDAAQLYRQLKLAAREVCAPADGRTLAEKHSFSTCVDAALSNAIARVDSPLLTSIHEANGKAAAIRVANR